MQGFVGTFSNWKKTRTRKSNIQIKLLTEINYNKIQLYTLTDKIFCLF